MSLPILAEIASQAGYPDSASWNRDFNQCLRTMLQTSDDYAATPQRADGYELVAKLRMFNLVLDRYMRGVPR